ncbi:hypothetical protein Pint_25552 [Pistacia integerrima]|uniref:Uncharacterized protein n=1 Tax=Pistacia integerrima TaxID=434235 RepID=A0ACC0YII0_9ROSI|nr:hypothetical protein Pint_25552 [Pistacia integerrima]
MKYICQYPIKVETCEESTKQREILNQTHPGNAASTSHILYMHNSMRDGQVTAPRLLSIAGRSTTITTKPSKKTKHMAIVRLEEIEHKVVKRFLKG